MTAYTITTDTKPPCTHEAPSPSEAARLHARRCLLRFVTLEDMSSEQDGTLWQAHARSRGSQFSQRYQAPFRVEMAE